MTFAKIKHIAVEHGIRVVGVKKADIVIYRTFIVTLQHHSV